MEPYKDIDGDSGVYAYEIGVDFIRVQFEDGGVYLYTYASAGSQNIERMKNLARTGTQRTLTGLVTRPHPDPTTRCNRRATAHAPER